MWRAFDFVICVLLSPTRVFMNWRRYGKPDQRDAAMVFAWTRMFFWLAVVLCGFFLIIEQFTLASAGFWLPLRIGVFVIALSRCNETVIAFANDARQWLEGKPYNRYISPVHRIGFVIQSYAEIWLFFALIACCLPAGMYDPPMDGDILTAIYFSGAAITTLGYGDIHPTHWVSRLLAIYEAMSGLFLSILAIGVYISQIVRRVDDPEA
jgi:voltage-gated potassium channel